MAAVLVLLAATPALAGEDQRYYEANRSQFISYEQAARIAVGHIGDGTAVEVDFDHEEHQGSYFEVDVRAADGREYDVKIDARTGKVWSSKLDD